MRMSGKKIAVGVGSFILLAAVMAVGLRVADSGEAGTELKENQRYAYVYVSSITGNEICYTEVEESVVEAYLEEKETDTGEESDGDMTKGADEGNPADRQTVGGFEGEAPGEMPEGEMPEGFQLSEGAEMPGGEMKADENGGRMEMVTALVPVGIPVHTASDTETTFQRLASGDILKILMETNDAGEEVMTEIWML